MNVVAWCLLYHEEIRSDRQKKEVTHMCCVGMEGLAWNVFFSACALPISNKPCRMCLVFMGHEPARLGESGYEMRISGITWNHVTFWGILDWLRSLSCG